MIDPTPPGLRQIQESGNELQDEGAVIDDRKPGLISRLWSFWRFATHGDESASESWYRVQYESLRRKANSLINAKSMEIARLEQEVKTLTRKIDELEAAEEVLKIQVKLSAETINAHLARLQMEASQYNALATQARKVANS